MEFDTSFAVRLPRRGVSILLAMNSEGEEEGQMHNVDYGLKPRMVKRWTKTTMARKDACPT